MGRRRLERENRKNQIKDHIKKISLFLLISLFWYMGNGIYQESKIPFVEENKINKVVTNKVEPSKQQAEKVETTVDSHYLGYSVIAFLEIPKIDLQTNILENYSTEALKVCVSKYWGVEPNEIGNFCIAGHNYTNPNMFKHLVELEKGDEIYLSDNKNGKCVYTIYDIYKVREDNIQPLSQNTNGKREITLITCVNYSPYRLIVKAAEL